MNDYRSNFYARSLVCITLISNQLEGHLQPFTRPNNIWVLFLQLGGHDWKYVGKKLILKIGSCQRSAAVHVTSHSGASFWQKSRSLKEHVFNLNMTVRTRWSLVLSKSRSKGMLHLRFLYIRPVLPLRSINSSRALNILAFTLLNNFSTTCRWEVPCQWHRMPKITLVIPLRFPDL